jgi:hypothetical protein
MDEDHYVETTYANFDEKRVFVGFSQSYQFASNQNYFFRYIFFEEEKYNARKDWQNDNLSEDVYMSLNVESLWREFDEKSWSTPFYETKLKHSLMAVFGEIEGAEIYKYVYSMYVDKRNNPTKYENKSLSKKFTTVKVDFCNDGQTSVVQLFFSNVRR